jgi:hypothetical protein
MRQEATRLRAERDAAFRLTEQMRAHLVEGQRLISLLLDATAVNDDAAAPDAAQP